jgi:hypothetical protein
MDPTEPNIEGRYRTLLTLWAAISMSILIFLGMTRFVPATAVTNAMVSLLLNCAGIIPLSLSILLKSQLLSKATQARRIEQVQTAYVVSFALSEMAALLAVLDHFINAGAYYYVGFIFAGLGMLLHFPQKKYLLAAAGREF